MSGPAIGKSRGLERVVMVQVLDRQKSTLAGKVIPPRLRRGDSIGIISPGRWMSEEDLATTCSHLERLGFKPQLHDQNFQRLHQFAGSDHDRTVALQSMLCDPNLKAVMFAKGGYGALRILDDLDYQCMANAPKIVIGFSDATALLIDLHRKANLVTYHGPMLYDLIEGIDSDTWKWFEAMMVNGEQIKHSFDSSSGARILRPGVGEGPLIGGSLTLLINLLCTDSDFSTDGRILFVEDDDEPLYSIDRMFVHLKRSGKLSNLKGLVVGQMRRISDNQIPFGYSVDEIVFEHCANTTFPIVAGFPFGHGSKQLIMPIGIQSLLEARAGSPVHFQLLEPPVS